MAIEVSFNGTSPAECGLVDPVVVSQKMILVEAFVLPWLILYFSSEAPVVATAADVRSFWCGIVAKRVLSSWPPLNAPLSTEAVVRSGASVSAERVVSRVLVVEAEATVASELVDMFETLRM